MLSHSEHVVSAMQKGSIKSKSTAALGKSSDLHASQPIQSSDPSSRKAAVTNPDSVASCATRLSSMSLDSATEEKLNAQRDLLRQSAARALSEGDACPGLDSTSQARLFILFVRDVFDLHRRAFESFLHLKQPSGNSISEVGKLAGVILLLASKMENLAVSKSATRLFEG